MTTKLIYFFWACAVMVTAIDFLLGIELSEPGKYGLALNAIMFPCYLLYKEERKK